VQESGGPPDFIGAGACRCQHPAAVVAVEMWKPASGAGFQARCDRRQIVGQDAVIGPTERHFHSEPQILPILLQVPCLAAAHDENMRLQKPAQNEHFYRLSCRASKSGLLVTDAQTDRYEVCTHISSGSIVIARLRVKPVRRLSDSRRDADAGVRAQ
jgi:hypothetical protein